MYEQPQHLPFLQAIAWQHSALTALTEDEILSLYERGWHYRGVLADLTGEELAFVQKLATDKKSWIVIDVCP
ncbi:MAG TPA: hypothetical protein PLW01_00360 [Agitococcus sp.]|uniref:hypothetical protein n=1 Tax=uncultured Agitococcus sp. TaxID=1506599 RepID=UPI002602B42B|nr:hypothetical protein [uncultured Agitococcus sp.]HRH90348.1 hypothetical protein [Agitococcus sp.]